MDLQLSGKRVFVTGASKGIGLAVARAFRQEGARVAINSSNPQNLARAQEVLGGDCLTLGGDLGDIDSIGSIFAQLEERWGGLDILVNNAAVMVRTPLLEIEPAQWDKIMNTMTMALAGELAPYNIRVNGYMPGLIVTEQSMSSKDAANEAERLKPVALRRYGTVEEMADVVLFLASPMSSYMTGETVTANGGKLAIQNPWKGWESK